MFGEEAKSVFSLFIFKSSAVYTLETLLIFSFKFVELINKSACSFSNKFVWSFSFETFISFFLFFIFLYIFLISLGVFTLELGIKFKK